VTHSNVAVKNIAETLFITKEVDFKLIVPEELYVEWYVPDPFYPLQY